MKRREEKSITLLTNILSFKLLIALLSILLFLISCKSNENPNTPEKPPRKKHELEGTWIGYDKRDTKYENYELKFTVDSDGNITFSPRPYRQEVELHITNIITNISIIPILEKLKLIPLLILILTMSLALI